MKQSKLISVYMKNDQLDIEKVMFDFAPYLYTIVRNKNAVFSEEDIEEIISDVFLAVWNNQKKLELEKPMNLYLLGIAKNMIYKKLKNTRKDYNVIDLDDNLYALEGIEFEIENAEKEQLILKELNNMKLEDKRIFVLYYYFSKAMKEIAVELSISEAKVKSRLFRIRRKLKKSLEKRGYYYEA